MIQHVERKDEVGAKYPGSVNEAVWVVPKEAFRRIVAEQFETTPDSGARHVQADVLRVTAEHELIAVATTELDNGSNRVLGDERV